MSDLPKCPVCGKSPHVTSSGTIYHGGHKPSHWFQFDAEEEAYHTLCALRETKDAAERDRDAARERVKALEDECDDLRRESDSAFTRGYERGHEDGRVNKLRPLGM